MKLKTTLFALCSIFFASLNYAEPIHPIQPIHPIHQDGISINQLRVKLPASWSMRQEAKSDGTLILGMKNGSEYITIYSSPKSLSEIERTFLAHADEALNDVHQYLSGINWRIVNSKHSTQNRGTVYVTAFAAPFQGHTYYGYSQSSSQSAAKQNVSTLLNQSISVIQSNRSLTGDRFKGKKYYLGWGAASSSDPSMMHNEVKYDVLHTHDVFTDKVGGNYLGDKMIGSVSGSSIKSRWSNLKSKMTKDDMFVQYSSGHGSHSGLSVGVTYNNIRDNILAMPAKELIVFTMACYSGNLVDSFNQKKSVWQNFDSQGRALLVMASSRSSQTSATGPGTDAEEAGAPYGSAGSAYGHALWKALIGHADGFSDGVKDGFLSIGEVVKYTTWKTKQVGGHTPVVTGSYNPNVLLAKVPSKTFLKKFGQRTTEGLSDDEVQDLVRKLDNELSIQ